MRHFFFFFKVLELHKFEGSYCKNGNRFCSLFPTKAQICPAIFPVDKFGALDLSYDVTFLNFLAAKYPNKVVFIANEIFFLIFSQNFLIRRIRGYWFQIGNKFFQLPAQKISNKAFLVPNLDISVFWQNFEFRQIWGCRFQIWQ